MASNNGAADGTESHGEHAQRMLSDAERAAERAAATAVDWIARFAERVREESEDIWAEAQAIRRGRHS